MIVAGVTPMFLASSSGYRAPSFSTELMIVSLRQATHWEKSCCISGVFEAASWLILTTESNMRAETSSSDFTSCLISWSSRFFISIFIEITSLTVCLSCHCEL